MGAPARLNEAIGDEVSARDTAFARLYGFVKYLEICKKDHDNPTESGDWAEYFGKYGFSISQLRRMLAKGISAKDLAQLPAADLAVDYVVEPGSNLLLEFVITQYPKCFKARSRKRVGNVIYLSPRDMGQRAAI